MCDISDMSVHLVYLVYLTHLIYLIYLIYLIHLIHLICMICSVRLTYLTHLIYLIKICSRCTRLTGKHETVVARTDLDNGFIFWSDLVGLRQIHTVVAILPGKQRGVQKAAEKRGMGNPVGVRTSGRYIPIAAAKAWVFRSWRQHKYKHFATKEKKTRKKSLAQT